MPLSVSFLETQGSFLKTQSWGGVGVSHLLHFLRHKDHFLRHKSSGGGGGGGELLYLMQKVSMCGSKMNPGPEIMKEISWSTQLSMNFFLLINV